MARNFGMTYEDNYYVHNDSIHILNLQENDLFFNHRGLCKARWIKEIGIQHGEAFDYNVQIKPLETPYLCHDILLERIHMPFPVLLDDDIIIIQRNKIPFLWPKKETI